MYVTHTFRYTLHACYIQACNVYLNVCVTYIFQCYLLGYLLAL